MVLWATLLFVIAAMIVVLLHLALFVGVPWGEMTLGGRYSGRLPPQARILSLAQATLLLGLAILVLHGSGLAPLVILPEGRWAVWIAVAVSAVSLVLNTITPSRRERMFGMPASLALLGSSLAVALGG